MKTKQYLARLPARVLPAALSALLSFLHANAAAQSAALAPDAGPDPLDTAYPVVITPTRLRQALADVPASVTVITSEMLRRYGITDIEDALRLVPGMDVSMPRGNEYRISNHGSYTLNPRRMNVLIDGVSAYRPAFARVEWPLLPVVIEDVDRIEVIRGPDASAYGPNSMTAVVNILTKHPKDVERGLVAVTANSRGLVDTTARLAAAAGPTSLRATVNWRRDTGYDYVPGVPDGHDGTRLKRLNLRAQSDLADGSALDLQASYVGGQLQFGDVGDPFQASYPDQRRQDMQLSGAWTKAWSADHELKVEAVGFRGKSRQHWVTCWPQVAYLPEAAELFRGSPLYANLLRQAFVGYLSNPAAPPSFDLPDPAASPHDNELLFNALAAALSLYNDGVDLAQASCGVANMDLVESRTQVEVQDTYVASSKLRFVGGLGLRYQHVDSQTVFGGTAGNTVRWAFGHAEYRAFDWLTANLGGYADSNSLSGGSFAPRLAFNARLSDEHALRLVLSQGTRTPDIYEEKANWSYTVTGLTPPVQNLTTPAPGASTAVLAPSIRAKGGLGNEHIWSRELGYLLTHKRLGLTLDARLFDDRLSDLVSDQITVDNLMPANNGSVRLTGAEVQTNWELTPTWSGLFSYAYLLNRQASSPEQAVHYTRHSGAIGVSHAFDAGWRASLAFYGASAEGLYQSRYARTDLTVSRSFRWDDHPAAFSWSLSYLDNPIVTTYQDVDHYYVAGFNNRLSIHGSVRVAF